MDSQQEQQMKSQLQHQRNLMEECKQDERRQAILSLESLPSLSPDQEVSLKKLQQEEQDFQRQQKQSFLREEVLENGLPAKEFMEHLQKAKEGGDNIDFWTLQELQSLVQEFSDEIRQDGKEMDDYDQNETIQTQMDLDLTVITEVPTQVHSAKDSAQLAQSCFKPSYQKAMEDTHLDIFACKQLKTASNIESMSIKVCSPQIRSAGLFGLGSSFTVYKVITEQTNKDKSVSCFEVFRRFSEFAWIRSVLHKCYPGRFVPSLFKKRSSKTTKYKQQKRLLFIQQFVDDLAINRDFMECPYFQAFLQKGDSQSKEFQKIVKKGKDLKDIRHVEHIVNSRGQVEGSINTENQKFLDDCNQYSSRAEYFYNNLKRLSKQLVIDLDNMSSTLYDMGDQYKGLFEVTNKISNSGKQDPVFEKLNETYVRLNNSTVNWGNHLVNQIQNVQDNLYNQLKYSCREFDSYRELLKKRNEEGEQYAKYKIKLEGKKEKLFNSSFNKSSKSSLTEEEKLQKQVAFESMLPAEGQVLKRLRREFSYYNNYCQLDMQRQLDRKISSYSTAFSALATNSCALNVELSKGCSDLITFFQRTKDERDKDELAQIDFMSELQQSMKIRGELERGKEEGKEEQNQEMD